MDVAEKYLSLIRSANDPCTLNNVLNTSTLILLDSEAHENVWIRVKHDAEEDEETNSLRDLIQDLTANMETNFAKLRDELCSLRQEMKEKNWYIEERY